MACPRKKATVSYIKEILSPAPRAFDPSREYSSRGGMNSVSPSSSWSRVQWGDEYSTNAITLFLADLPHSYPTACRPGFYPTGASPSTRNTNQLKEQWSLQIPLSYARSPSGVFMKRAFLYASRLFFLKR